MGRNGAENTLAQITIMCVFFHTFFFELLKQHLPIPILFCASLIHLGFELRVHLSLESSIPSPSPSLLYLSCEVPVKEEEEKDGCAVFPPPIEQ
jgi:hypothetical protein